MKWTVREPLTFGWADYEGDLADYVAVGNYIVPPWVRAHFAGVDGQPELDLRLEVVDGVPQCRELRIASTEGGRELRPLDLSAVKLANWVEDIYSVFANRFERAADGSMTMKVANDGPTALNAANVMHRARKGRPARKVNTDLLTRVAKVYVEHKDGSPVVAVATAFGVKRRMATNYVQRAREAGLLPTEN